MSVHDAIFCTVQCRVTSQNSMLIVLRHFIETVWWKTWSVERQVHWQKGRCMKFCTGYKELKNIIAVLVYVFAW